MSLPFLRSFVIVAATHIPWSVTGLALVSSSFPDQRCQAMPVMVYGTEVLSDNTLKVFDVVSHYGYGCLWVRVVGRVPEPACQNGQ